MKSWLVRFGATSLITAGTIGQWFGYPALAPYAIWFLGAGLVMLLYAASFAAFIITGVYR